MQSVQMKVVCIQLKPMPQELYRAMVIGIQNDMNRKCMVDCKLFGYNHILLYYNLQT